MSIAAMKHVFLFFLLEIYIQTRGVIDSSDMSKQGRKSEGVVVARKRHAVYLFQGEQRTLRRERSKLRNIKVVLDATYPARMSKR